MHDIGFRETMLPPCPNFFAIKCVNRCVYACIIRIRVSGPILDVLAHFVTRRMPARTRALIPFQIDKITKLDERDQTEPLSR